jgi:hypothetical protein
MQSLLFLLALLFFLLLFLLLLALLQEFLEVVHDLLVGEDAKLDEEEGVAFLHEGDELGGGRVVDAVAVHVDVDEGRVLPQHLFNLLDDRDFLGLTELIVPDVQLAEGLVGLQSSEELVDPFVFELVADQRQVLDLAVVEGKDFLEVEGAFIVDAAAVEH